MALRLRRIHTNTADFLNLMHPSALAAIPSEL